ncbi:putative non-ribosomal peptide synthetase [Gordonia hirsuta DSM 44140 = NBRC 16056]|uniref:Putative non-ribosomal peptide synthetase n=2 Tax=Gordonia hirsuta TaxID=53427 RepID=L7L5N1_9ACTN|nr:putative non-ribosomal peptide synthetase [Gordonia hirsuta DSM 44140 = NBRC 16056]
MAIGGSAEDGTLIDILSRRDLDGEHSALICGETEVSYDDFEARTNRIARALLGRGVRPDDIVAVGLERSVESVLAIWGIVKSGAAYLPIDPAYPDDRIAYMLEDSAVGIGITDASTRSRMGETDCAWLELESLEAEADSGAPIVDAERNGSVRLENLVYVIYTSGSTGRPKGVAIANSGMVDLVANLQKVTGSREDDPDTRVLHVGALSFDASILEMVWGISAGHTLVLAPHTDYAGAALDEVIEHGEVTDLIVTPSVLATLNPERAATVRNLVTGGEACPPELVQRWAARGRRLWNFYGPTEITIWATRARMTPRKPVTIGRAQGGFTARILDQRLHEVPDGVMGELYLSASGLARGYLERPDLSATSFVADPFGAPGARMYATGDMVRLVKGDLEFAGRADHQVKINGQRVELGEIEAVLADSPGVAQAVIIGREVEQGDRKHTQLVAYLVPRPGESIDPDAVAAEAANHLAAHMIPAQILVIDDIPLTPSGKLDRAALPEPEGGTRRPDYIAPKTDQERLLADIIGGLLGVERLGVTESFFALGGDSIMSIQVASAAKAAGVGITPREIFEHKTVRGIARAATSGAAALPILDDPDDGRGELALSPVMSWMTQAAPTPADFADFNQAQILFAPAEMSVEDLAELLAAVVEAHPMLSARLVREDKPAGLWFSLDKGKSLTTIVGDAVSDMLTPGGRWVLTAGEPFDAAASVGTFEVAADAGSDEFVAAVTAAHAADAARLDPATGRLVRATLVTGNDGARVVLTIHHLAVDTVSWPVILEDLVTGWAQVSADQPIALRGEVTSEQAWNNALAARVGEFAGELDYWLARSPQRPTDLGREFDPAATRYSETSSHLHELAPDLTSALLQRVPEAFGAQLTDVLLAALARAVRSWQRDQGIDDGAPVGVLSEGHGRYEEILAQGSDPRRADLARTVGWFTSIAPLSIDPSADPVHAVKAAKEERLSRPNQGIGFGLLRYGGNDELEARPLPSIAFNYLGGGGGADQPTATPAGEPIPLLPAGDAVFLPGAVSGGMAAMSPLVINAQTIRRADGPVIAADFRFPESVLSTADAEDIARRWSDELATIVAAVAVGDPGLSPSDVPGTGVTQDDLDLLAERFPGADVWPLTPLQRGLYFQSELAGDETVDVYLTQATLRLGGDVDLGRLRRATDDLLEHHRALRSAFVRVPSGAVVTVIVDGVRAGWREVDLGAADRETVEERIAGIEREEKLKPFALDASPLLRVVVVRYDGGLAVVITNHHLLFDGWSGPLVMADLLAIYGTGFTYTGRLSSPDTDFAAYVRRIGAADRAAGIAAWRPILDRIDEPTLLAPAAEASAETLPRDLVVPLGRELAEAIDQLAREQGVTISTILQFAWAVLLSRLTGNRTVAFAETVSGRPADLDGVETMVGLFINTLPVVVDVDPGAAASEVLRVLQGDKVAVLDHQHLGLPELTALTGLPVLFDTLTVYESYPVDTESLSTVDASAAGGLEIVGATASDATHYPLNLAGAPTADGLQLTLKYLPSAFSEDDVQTFGRALENILGAVAADPALKTVQIPLLAGADSDEGIVPADAPAAEELTLIEQFSRRTLDPQHPALICGDEVIDYAEFESRTNSVARSLLARGITPGQIVAVGLVRSIDSVVAICGILKAGAAYVPIDPNYPEDRVAFMISDSGVRIGVTDSDTRAQLGGDCEWIGLAELLDAADDPITDADRGRPVTLDDLAYLTYTSGTTGRPKAVGNTQRGTATLALGLSDLTRESVSDGDARILHVASPSFDAAFLEFAWSIVAGRTMVIAPADAYAGPALERVLDEGRVTSGFITPSVLATLDPGAGTALRVIAVGGEAVPLELVDRWASRPGLRVVDAYGPTETTALAIRGDLRPGERVVIGGMWRGFTGYVLDNGLNPVPQGMTGELYLSSPVSLARGYLGRSALTSSRFVADPFADRLGARMYATGDLVRVTGERAIDYVGRIDHQVKINGQRIELGEVEAVLAALPGVAEAVVVAVGTPARSLAGYVVGDGETVLDEVVLIAKAACRLPGYMVPASITVLESMPLTPVGKLDRAALPEPADATVGTAYVAPATEDERAVAEVFAEVLGVDRVGALDSFFELGGNSLSATRLAARATAALGREIGVRDVFTRHTVRELAATRSTSTSALAPITAVSPRPCRIPLSFAQQRMWFINQLAPGDATYNIPAVMRLTGDLDVNALRAAVVDVVERHEVLRTVFPESDGVPYQSIAPRGEVNDGIDWKLVDSQTELEVDVRTGFDVTSQWPFRVRLWPVAPGEYVLAVVAHHIAADGASVAPLVADLLTAYAARMADDEPQFVPLDVQFADYAIWQNAELGATDDPDSVIGRQLDYWRIQLEDSPDVLELPSDRQRPAVASGRGARHGFSIPADTVAAVESVARVHGATPFMVMHAALAVLLSRLASVDDVSVATPVAGRGHQVLDPLVGMFVNTLVLRTVVDDTETFGSFLDRVREIDLQAFAHADVPFESIVDAMSPVRSQAFAPLAQVILSFNNATVTERGGLGTLEITAVEAPEPPARVDLQFEIQPGSSDWLVSAIYATDLFDEVAIAALADRYVRLLADLVTDPLLPVGDVAVLSAAEVEVLAALPAPVTETVHAGYSLVDLFAGSSAAFSERMAVSTSERSLSYRELDARADAIAAGLWAQGVGPGDVTGVATARSVDLAAAILGVLKVGAAYLPLDLGNPVERLRFIVADAAVDVVLTDSSSAGHPLWESVGDAAVVDVDALIKANLGSSAPQIVVQADSRAYVIYTSGSTGLPKGVEVTHRDVVTLMDTAAADFDFRADDVWTMFHSYAFDFSVWELWGPLLSGARLVVVDRELARDPEAFVGLLADEGVTVLSQTPSAFYQLIDARLRTQAELGLRYVVFGGEALSFEQVRRWFDEFPEDSAELVNMYGITETTVHVTFRSLDRALVSAGDASLIGRPLASLAIHVLDERLHPVPDGVVGEMYVAGGQLAQGYLNRSGLTSSRFVADPFGAPGRRLYRTGDLARRVGGDIEYLGRGDAQVQLRGFRIEYGEVESGLLRAGGVAAAAARVYDDPVRGEQLVGYVVPEVGAVVNPAVVRAAAADFVPSYMVPDVVMVIDGLPLTANGKLDRDSLPLPTTVVVAEYVAPESDVEEGIAAAFADVLGVDRVSVRDSFFDVGGNSLSAVRLRARLQSEYGLDIELAWLFSNPTPRALAAQIVDRSSITGEVVIPLRSDGDGAPLFCVHPAGGLAWFYGGLVPFVTDRPIYGIQDPYVVTGEPQVLDAEQLAARYVSEIRQVQPHGPYHLLGWSIGGAIAHAMATHLEAEGESVAYLGIMDAAPVPEDVVDPLEVGPLEEESADDVGEADVTQTAADLLGGWRDLFGLGEEVTAATVDEVSAVVRDQIASMGLLDEDQVDRIVETFATSDQMLAGYRPQSFDGPIQLFVATADKGDPDALVRAWDGHVAHVETIMVDTHHLGMANAEALAVIGPEIDARLSAPETEPMKESETSREDHI